MALQMKREELCQPVSSSKNSLWGVTADPWSEEEDGGGGWSIEAVQMGLSSQPVRFGGQPFLDPTPRSGRGLLLCFCVDTLTFSF